MTSFEAELNHLVARFASELADRARLAAYQMVIQALERGTVPDRPRRRSRRHPVVDPSIAMRVGLMRATDEFHRQCIARALSSHNGNITHAAHALGLVRPSLQRIMRRLEMPRGKLRGGRVRKVANKRRGRRAREAASRRRSTSAAR